MKRIFFVLITMLFLAGCSPNPEKLQVLVEQTLTAIPTGTAYPTYTPYPTYTVVPTTTRTPKPTQTPTQPPNFDPTGLAVAKNNVAVFESRGVKIEIVRIVIADKSWGDVASYSYIPDWKNANSYIMLEFKASNNSEDKASLMLMQASMIAASGKQVSGSDYIYDLDYFGDDPDSDLMPGVSMQGGYWLPLETPFNEIQTVYMDFVGAFINSNGIFRNMELKLDISDWTFEPRIGD